MKKISTFALFALFILAGFGCSSDASTERTDAVPAAVTSPSGGASGTKSMPEPPKIETSSTKTLTFTPDTGKRVEVASNAGLQWQADGTLAMVFEDLAQGGEWVRFASSGSDYLEFGSATKLKTQVPYRATKLADGTYRAYGFDPTRKSTNACLTSLSSTDGVTFTEDSGCRYTLQADDEGSIGTYETYIQADGKVVLLYVGDLYGKNNIRRAVSTDGGWTFTFDRGNVVGDDSFGGGGRSFVDQRIVKLSDGTYVLIAMSSGSIYGFTSADGDVFNQLPELVLSVSDFQSIDSTYISLHDPQITVLPDGRYRIYVTALIKQGTGPKDRGDSDLVSATAPALAE